MMTIGVLVAIVVTVYVTKKFTENICENRANKRMADFENELRKSQERMFEELWTEIAAEL